MENVVKPEAANSSIITHAYHYPHKKQAMMPTWALLVILVIAFFILKYFIYLADEKRHGK